MLVCGGDVQRRFGAEPTEGAATLKRCPATRGKSANVCFPAKVLALADDVIE